MKVLVIGGTSYFGIHLVRRLVIEGHIVTIATRGLAKDDFGQSVKRLNIDRKNPESVTNVLSGRSFDVICDNICFSSNEVKYLLDAVKTNRYILTSSRGVYHGLADENTTDESGFDPFSHKLSWCSFDDNISYYEAKRQAESALFQNYREISSVAARFPIVIGKDDNSNRLGFFVEHIMNERTMYIVNPNIELSCIRSDEAGNFLAWLTTQSITGPINASCSGEFCVGDIIEYIEKKTHKKAIFSKEGDAGTCNTTTKLRLETTKAVKVGYKFSNVDSWIYDVLDSLIQKEKSSA